MTLVEGEELQRLWALVSELSSQLTANRQLCHSLQVQADELKGQALHTGTGYTLRRFNLDISKEKFESDLEKLNSQLVLENQSLSHENKQINLLLREYENTLESVMAKFRSFSHATQQHTLSLTSHYETLLASSAHQSESNSLHESTTFSNTLAHLGGLVRLALREVEGEGVESEDEEVEEARNADPFEAEGYRVGSPSGIGPSSHTEPRSSKINNTKKAKTAYGSAPTRDPRWYGTGGYTGLQGDPEAEKAERALQAKTEEERLQRENETLRELLRISADITPEVAREFGIEIPAPPTSTSWPALGSNSGKLSLGKPRGSRKSIAEASTASKAEESAAATTTTDTDEVKVDENLLEQDTEEAEADLKKQSLGMDPDYNPPSSTGISEAVSNKIVPSHVVEGSGGPPQLSANPIQEEAKKEVEVTVTSEVGKEEKDKLEGRALEEKLLSTETVEEKPIAEATEEGLGLDDTGVEAMKEEKSKTIADTETIAAKEAEREKMLEEAEEAIIDTQAEETTVESTP